MRNPAFRRSEICMAAAVVVMITLSWLLHSNCNKRPPLDDSYSRSALWCSAESDHQTKSADRGETTVDPAQFAGSTKEAYKFARRNPAILEKLHCYCGCDQTDGHKSLLDCFRSYHGAWCEVGTSEAIQAEALSDLGNPADQIREFLRQRFNAPK